MTPELLTRWRAEVQRSLALPAANVASCQGTAFWEAVNVLQIFRPLPRESRMQNRAVTWTVSGVLESRARLQFPAVRPANERSRSSARSRSCPSPGISPRPRWFRGLHGWQLPLVLCLTDRRTPVSCWPGERNRDSVVSTVVLAGHVRQKRASVKITDSQPFPGKPYSTRGSSFPGSRERRRCR